MTADFTNTLFLNVSFLRWYPSSFRVCTGILYPQIQMSGWLMYVILDRSHRVVRVSYPWVGVGWIKCNGEGCRQ